MFAGQLLYVGRLLGIAVALRWLDGLPPCSFYLASLDFSFT
jgi:hypothetical protein